MSAAGIEPSPTPEQRSELALQCACEIQSWAKLIGQWVEREGLNEEGLWLHGAAIRLDSLASAVMTAVQPEEPISEAEEWFRGPGHLRAKVKS